MFKEHGLLATLIGIGLLAVFIPRIDTAESIGPLLACIAAAVILLATLFVLIAPFDINDPDD